MKNLHIYVVDDDPVYRLVAHKLLTQASPGTVSVEFFENAASCLLKIDEEVLRGLARKPDVILLDIEMPVMNGWGFLEAFFKIPFEKRKCIRVYIVSSSIAGIDLQRAAEYPGIVEYIPKPLTREIVGKILAAKHFL